jgi:transcriptional regulator with XRE-family HTH domain
MRSFARALRKSPTFVWKVEHGRAVPGNDTLEKMAVLLGHRDEIFQAARRIPPEIADILTRRGAADVVRRARQLLEDEKHEATVTPRDGPRVAEGILQYESSQPEVGLAPSDYRRIEIDPGRPLSDRERDTLTQLFGRLPRSDATFAIEKGLIVVMVRSLDVVKFRAAGR